MDINLVGFIPALLPVALSPGASFTLVMNSALVFSARRANPLMLKKYVNIGGGIMLVIFSLSGLFTKADLCALCVAALREA